ncbi:MAG: DUF5134 domain-containing protein [Pseudonocardia sp.]|nr:DUF5134 domain-containing protein [Pseudonocardia sp.]
MTLAGGWSGVLLAAACALAGLYFVWQLATRRRAASSASVHAVMAAGMVAMFVPAADPLPAVVWAGVFLLVGVWYAAAAIRAGSLQGEPGHHMVGAGAMLFMLVGHASHHTHAAPVASAAGGGQHAQHAAAAAAGAGGGLAATAVALALAAWFIADIVRRLVDDRRPAVLAGTASAGVRVVAGQRTGIGSLAAHLVMSGAMTIMLLGMV